MSPDELNSLEVKLQLSPLDWDLRLAVIQGHVLLDQMQEAKRWVRESPDEAGPTPPHLQHRLHRLMTEGQAAAKEFAREEGAGYTVGGGVTYSGSVLPLHVELGNAAAVEHAGEGEGFSGGAEGLLGVAQAIRDEFPVSKTPAPKADGGPPKVLAWDRSEDEVVVQVGEARKRLRELDNSGFVMESALEFPPHEREPAAGRKMSAFSFALLSHMMLVFLLGAVVIAIPRPNPPQIVAVNVAQDQILDVPPKRVDQVQTPDRSASAAAATVVISSTVPTPIAIPEFDKTSPVNVVAMVTDVKAGLGMSLEGEAEESDVNFFGIQSGGRRIAFIVDAAPTMLVDEKGGMFAYDKVKDEVGQMLASLNRGTLFNIFLYEGKRLKVYQKELVQARPSNVRLAISWLDPLNRDYESLGLGRTGADGRVSGDNEPVASGDISGYAKAIQAALEMDVNTVFCIAGGYERIARAMVPEAGKKAVAETPGTVDPGERAAWNKAVLKTREWLRKENEARRENGLPPKVVPNFSALVRQVTGATPPQARGGSGVGARGSPPYTPEEIEEHIKNLVKRYYREEDKDLPQLNLVLFLGKGEDIGEYKEHFRRLTRRNRGKLKILEGLEALTDVTAGG
jgi:hypothetical protein